MLDLCRALDVARCKRDPSDFLRILKYAKQNGAQKASLKQPKVCFPKEM